MKILVTGGLGFVGSSLVPKLLTDRRCTEVTVLDNLSYSAVPEQLDVYRSFPAFHFVEGSILGEELVTELLHTVDGVIHLAAETYVDKSIISSRPFWMTNVIGTLTLIEAACRSSLQKFVHVSTDEVWGQALGDVSFSENSPYRPRNPYAASKAAADHLVQSAGETYHLPHNIVHFTNLYRKSCATTARIACGLTK